MYLRHFGLQQTPFSLTPNTAFYVDLPQHHEALEVLTTALNVGEGFIKVTGEVGTGKTMLCRKLMNEAPEDWVIAYIPDPYLSPVELRWAFATELGLKQSDTIDNQQLVQLLQHCLVALAAEGKRVVLIIDEAQALPDDTLEALRLLTNLETEQRKLLQVVLFGQPELDKRLASYKFRQLRQRVSFSYFLRGMSYYEVQAYISARVDIAGVRQPLFSPGALKAIWKYSRGIPRLVNVLSHKGLMLAFGENKLQVDTRHVRYAAKDTEDVRYSNAGLNPVWLGVLVSSLMIAAAAAWHFRGVWL
ncbi:MAG: AAA family ATPase [Gammaproteobacteria bacterium]|nr:AAA family ATPase [Gammaproteobacteria bacterium]MBU2056831.1 AAA family ATPase [Gammaproteobacteria bacterium]MBU2174637.1 AAA family ATPase [Gammaproteobacteria bacterium]MBU2248330.1 AAA family ATPase [Gammaproteobacteria bacterium]MBU2346199.1 AAA family ATPase [Gammaproteobacteria bacterium]